MTHDVIDWILGIANLAAILFGCLVAIYLPRRLARNDGYKEELAKQGDRIARHTTEIRHIQREQSIQPFDQYWDK